MDYKDFDIAVVSKAEGGYGLDIASPAGEGKSILKLARSAEETMSQLRSLGRAIRGSSGAQAARGADTAQRGRASLAEGEVRPQDIGGELFDALFTGAARSLFDQSIGMTRGDGLRIKLRIDTSDSDVAWLAQLPWELLYRAETREYLNLSRGTPLVRYLEVQRPFTPLPFQPPLKVLVVMACPEGVEALDLERERSLIDKSWGRDEDVEVEFLANATVQKLSETLAEGTYHVVHFMGHGDFDSDSGSGALLFEDDEGRAEPVAGRTLGVLLRDEPSVRLVFLNACETAKLTREEGLDPFAGVATALVMAGVPAVVAMQFPVSDEAAIDFSACFYSRLVKGLPVDAAVAEGRKAVRISDDDSLEWATPVLFMRSPDGVLFEAQSPPPEAPTAPIPEPASPPAPAQPLAAPTASAGVTSWKKKVLWAGAAIVAAVAAISLLTGGSEDTADPLGDTGADSTAQISEGSLPPEGGPAATESPSAARPVQEETAPAPVAVSTEGRIVEDLSHGEALLPDSIRPVLRSQDYSLGSLTGQDPYASLGPNDVVVISMARTNDGQLDELSAGDISRLRQHLEGGGGVLLAGLGWVWTNYELRPIDEYPFNVFAEPYGIYFAADYVVRANPDDDKRRFTSEFMDRSHPAVADVQKLFIGNGIPGSLVLSGSAVPLVWGADDTVGGDGNPNPVVIAAAEVGPGRLLCVQHHDFLRLMNSENDGKALLASALAWLSHRS